MTATENFLNALASGRSGSSSTLGRGCYGRIVRTREQTPYILAQEVDRQTVMVMGPAALRSLLGKSGYEIVVQIGHTREYIAAKLAAGYRYHAVVFTKPQSELKLATWNNCLSLAARLYPRAAPLFRRAGRTLKANNFQHFESLAGFSFAEVDAAGPSDERFMTLERLLASDGSALAVRRFLYHVLRLSELYSGDGYTRTHEGFIGVREYIIANRRLDELPDCKSLALDVQLPD